MNKLILPFLLLSATMSFAQVGLNTDDPKATLQVIGKPNVVSAPDGVIAPKITRAELIAKTAYTSAQTGAIVYVTDLSGTTNSATSGVKAIGYYYFDGGVWRSMNASISQFSYGDIKTGIQTADHNGWVKLDGRAKTSLTSSQQTQASALGIGINLPDATNSFLVQNGATLGSVNGSNTKTIAQNQLPNVRLYSASTGSGNWAWDVSPTTSLVDKGEQGSNTYSADLAWSTTEPTGGRTSSLNGDVTQQALDITPRSLSVNTFIYLGE